MTDGFNQENYIYIWVILCQLNWCPYNPLRLSLFTSECPYPPILKSCHCFSCYEISYHTITGYNYMEAYIIDTKIYIFCCSFFFFFAYGNDLT